VSSRFFTRSAKALPQPWQEVRQHEATLRDAWGLAEGEKGEGYRRRLRRLCDFLGELDWQAGTTPADSDVDFARLQRGLLRSPRGAAAREAYLGRLAALAAALAALIDGGQGREYLQHWLAWQQQAALWDGPFAVELQRALAMLGARPSAEPPRATAHGCLLDLEKVIGDLADRPAAGGSAAAARKRWHRCVEDLAGDHEWAYLQVRVRQARECLQERACQHAQTAKDALSIAIPRLEKRHSIQPAADGLYGLLAVACLALAKADGGAREACRQEIESALVYARRAVEIAPESIRERLVLLAVLSYLGDPEDIRVQVEIALNLDSGPDTLRTIGDSYWARTVALRGRGARRKLLQEATGFFFQALENVESAALDASCPLNLMQAHGWVHFWLGRFLSERGRYAEAAAHLRTSSSLGFKPLEAKVELAWTCWLARDRGHADLAFREALAEAARQRVDGAKVADAPGEQRPIEDLAFESSLGWAFLCAEWDPERALQYADQARDLLPAITRPNHPELKSAVLEVRGRIAVRRGEIDEACKLFEDAVRLSPRSGAYCALGAMYLSRARTAGAAAAPAALLRAREMVRLGHEADIRGRYRRELWDLNRELRRSEANPSGGRTPKRGATPGGATPSGGAAAGSAAPPVRTAGLQGARARRVASK
jgi:tetratricopeptide (TPR) repeat protein